VPKYRRSDIHTPALPQKTRKGRGSLSRKDDAKGWASPRYDMAWFVAKLVRPFRESLKKSPIAFAIEPRAMLMLC
jgi:hypothetical protein